MLSKIVFLFFYTFSFPLLNYIMLYYYIVSLYFIFIYFSIALLYSFILYYYIYYYSFIILYNALFSRLAPVVCIRLTLHTTKKDEKPKTPFFIFAKRTF